MGSGTLLDPQEYRTLFRVNGDGEGSMIAPRSIWEEGNFLLWLYIWVEDIKASDLRYMGWVSDGATLGEEAIQLAGDMSSIIQARANRYRKEPCWPWVSYVSMEHCDPHICGILGGVQPLVAGHNHTDIIAPILRDPRYRGDSEWRGLEASRVSE